MNFKRKEEIQLDETDRIPTESEDYKKNASSIAKKYAENSEQIKNLERSIKNKEAQEADQYNELEVKLVNQIRKNKKLQKELTELKAKLNKA